MFHVKLKAMKSNEIRFCGICELFSGRAILALPLVGSDAWTSYLPLRIRKTCVYFLCEVCVPISVVAYVGKPDIVTLRRCVVYEASSFVAFHSDFRDVVLSHYAQCFLRYDFLKKEYRIVLVFPCKVR